MSKNKKLHDESVSYKVNSNISVFEEFKFGKDIIKPGDNIQFKDVRGIFKFIRLAHNAVNDVTWIDCFNPTTGEYRSFYTNKLKGLVKNKVKRQSKKASNVRT